MKKRIFTLIVFGALFGSNAFAGKSINFNATTAGISASDLAAALGVNYWSYKLHFTVPVSSVMVGLSEFHRAPNGQWIDMRVDSYGLSHVKADISDFPVEVFLNNDTDNTFSIDIAGNRFSTKMKRKIDLSNMWLGSAHAQFFHGCLILAVKEKNPHVCTGKEENYVRVIALSIETK